MNTLIKAGELHGSDHVACSMWPAVSDRATWGTAVNYGALGPKIPIRMPDTAAVRLLRCAVMTDLNFANEAVVTMSIAPRDTKHAALLLVLSIKPDTLDLVHVVALQHGTQTAVPLHHVPGMCVDIAQTKVRSLFGVTPVGFGA